LNSGEVKSIAQAPFEAPLLQPTAVRAGDKVAVVGILCSFDAAASVGEEEPPCSSGSYASALYDPAQDAWTAVEVPAPLAGVKMGFVAKAGTAGDSAVFLLGDVKHKELWALSSQGKWLALDAPNAVDAACVSGSTVLALSTSYDAGGEILPHNPADDLQRGQSVGSTPSDGYVQPVVAYRDIASDEGWKQSPPLSDVKYPTEPPRISCLDGAGYIVDPVAIRSQGLFDLTSGAWRLPAAAPSTAFFRDRVWTGSELVFLPTEADSGLPAYAYDPQSDQWRALAPPPPVTRGALLAGRLIAGYAEPLPWADDSQGQRSTPVDPKDVAPPQVHQGTAGIFTYNPNAPT
jgi:hypothetical protein